jgi:hypothetical protein
VTRLGRVAAVVTVLGSVTTLSACGNSVPAVVATYRVTFVAPGAGVNDLYVDPVYSLILSQDRHFVLVPSAHGGATFKGTWNESPGQLMLNTPKESFVALVKGRDLRQGQAAFFGPNPIHWTFTTWSAVRT